MLDPNPKKRYLVDKCLEIGYRSSLFKKTCNSYIVDADADNIVDDIV
jgi:hypothetical protein